MDASKKAKFIKDWILDYVNSMPKKAESLVIGISGGCLLYTSDAADE